ncbi:MAG: flagellar hook-basal body complex protein [Candidatus Aquilonibacter sp.]
MAFDSLYTGISGLDAYQSWIDMISNNIANTATVGFKAQRMTFADQFYQQVGSPSGPTQTSGGVNPIDNGLGVKVNTVDTEFGQGGLETTGINTDLALNGDGFFIENNANGTGSPTYTRDGAFSLNSNGLFYDPASGQAIMGYMANSAGVVTPNGTPGAITIPVGLQEQATATGQGVKTGPAINDQVFDVALGGNLDQTNWSQAFEQAIGASANPGAAVTVSTTLYDSLGGSHEATITYTPVALNTTLASVAQTGAQATALTVAPTTTVSDQITITEAAGTYTVKDGNTGATQTALGGQTLTVGGATFTLATPAAAGTDTINVTAAANGLPSVANSAGTMVQAATEWQVNVSFADGTQFQTITTGASIASTGTLTAATLGQGTSGVVGFAYFDQNGQFINSSSIASVANSNVTGIPEAIGANAPGYFHDAGATASLQQGNQLNVLQWGPSAGNNAQAPTNTATPGAIALGFFDNTSLNSSSSGTVVSQNGYSAGTLSNITVGDDGTITGSFTNGQQKALAQLAIATFQNEDGLERIGGNQFAETAASGLAQLGTANTGRFGSIVAGSLEESNVNLANEFTNLIIAQRAFEANSRGIQTADQNLITITHIQASEN